MDDKITISTTPPEYRTLSEWPAYRFGADGSVWSCWTRGPTRAIGAQWRQLRTSKHEGGYRIVYLCDGANPPRTKKVSALVCASFHGPRPAGHHCRHLNGDRTDDRAENLAWGTASENSQDQQRHGTTPRGEQHGRAKLTDAQVAELRAIAGTCTQREAARRFGLSQRQVSNIWSGRNRAQTLVVAQLLALFPDEQSARHYIESRRWPDGPRCPVCASDRIGAHSPGIYRCNACEEAFTVRTGTVMERSKIPMTKWLHAMYLLVTSRNGISSMQLSKELSIRQASAWFLLHRLREACGKNLDTLRGIAAGVGKRITYAELTR